MTSGLLTPLQLIAGSALINNGGITVGYDLTQSINQYNQTAVISAWQNAVNYYVAQSWSTPSTLEDLLSIGNSVCAALGNSIPTGAPTPRPVAGPVNTGFSGLVVDTANLYLGNGDVGKFAQAFFAAQSYCSSANLFINSAVNAQTYLGPTFTGMDSLTTNNISVVNANFDGFGTDLFNQGKLYDLANIDLYGTPAGLLQQIAKVARIQSGTLKIIEAPLLATGLTTANIKTLISGGTNITESQFNQLQKLAYTGMTQVTGDELAQVLAILNVTTPNIQNMAELLDQKKIFPNSYKTLATPTANGPEYIYQANGSVNMNLAQTVNQYLPTASGCEELGKIIPPDQAVATKSVQVALQQITGITTTTLPAFAQVVKGSATKIWNINYSYLANDLVAYGSPIAIAYRAQQNVPVGIDINDTQYWISTSLGGLSTMAGLPAIQEQTSVLPSTVVEQYSNMATGSGPNGTVNTCDVIGLAIDYNNFAAAFSTATTTISTMPASTDLTNLVTAYQNMLGASNNVEMQTFIDNANTAISNIANPLLHPEYISYVNTLNLAFSSMASTLSQEKTYQTQGGIDYAAIQGGDKSVVYAFVQTLPSYGTQVEPAGPAYFLNLVADLSTLGGQSIVGVMREATNNQRLNAGQLGLNTTPSSVPAVTPSPVITPVF